MKTSTELIRNNNPILNNSLVFSCPEDNSVFKDKPCVSKIIVASLSLIIGLPQIQIPFVPEFDSLAKENPWILLSKVFAKNDFPVFWGPKIPTITILLKLPFFL